MRADFIIILGAIIILTAMGMAAVVIMGLHPLVFDKSLIPVVVGLIAPTILSLLAVLKGYQNGMAIKDLHIAVDGRLSQLLASTTNNATLVERAAGVDRAIDVAKQTDKTRKPERAD
jgi:hypothetical protein